MKEFAREHDLLHNKVGGAYGKRAIAGGLAYDAGVLAVCAASPEDDFLEQEADEMKLHELALVNRVILVAASVMIFLALAFPVKETVMWGWKTADRFSQGWVPVEEMYSRSNKSWARLPFPSPGPVGRAFILSDRQRKIRIAYPPREYYFKEVPTLPRIAFDVFFVVLCGLGAAYIAHGRRSRPIGPSGGVGDSKLP